MDKYLISQQHEKEMVIKNFPGDLDHIPVILNDDLPSAEANDLVLDMLQSDSSVRVLMIGESHHSASVLSCEAQIGSRLDIFSATFDTVSEVEHVWSSAVAGLDRLQVLWVRRGVAVLLSRSALPADLPRLKSPNPRGKSARGRGGPGRGRTKRNSRGPQSCRAQGEPRLLGSASGRVELQQAAEELGCVPHAAASSPGSEGTSSGTRSKTWTPSDKPCKSRGRGAREASLGDFMRLGGLRSRDLHQRDSPSVNRTKFESKKGPNNMKCQDSLEIVRPVRDCERVCSSGEDVKYSKTPERASPSHVVSHKGSSPPEAGDGALEACNYTDEKDTISNSISASENTLLRSHSNQVHEMPASNCYVEKFEAVVSSNSGDESSESRRRHSDLGTLPAVECAASQRTYDQKKQSSERKVSFHLPLDSQTEKERSFAGEGPSVKPKASVLGVPRNNKRNTSKNKRKKDDEKRELNEYSSNPLKNQAISAKVC